jgi:hypothetical protein
MTDKDEATGGVADIAKAYRLNTAAMDRLYGGKSLRIRAGFDQTSKGVVSGTWTVEGTGYTRDEVLAELDALSDEVLARVKKLNAAPAVEVS